MREYNHLTDPIRTYAEAVQIMRQHGDRTVTVGSAQHIERRALAKIKKELEAEGRDWRER